ncbi:MAG: 2-C-methyl-D-erythritol 4-phosphate cytidylyltransferase [Candidatus Omnitrophica bacterium]|nr:2-C-methyl-D-erythritol 4-phosphate cytidylyltransferase [Candidatus Omnitrophota bacterium]MDD5775413.1 2-C-methyl-D-erythritol 4-phosphate cytidylyltransferase [Candidatus Omnitrophota bacterium]
MMNICAVVLAAGRGERLKSKVSKPLVRLGSKQVLEYSLRVLSACPEIASIVVVANRSNRRAVVQCVRASGSKKVIGVVNGGTRRQDSVKNGLGALAPECGYVMVHDAARPFVDAACLARLIRAARRTGAAIPGVPVKATIKEIVPARPGSGGIVRQTLDRSRLWEIQTPQLFRKDIVLKAYRACAGAAVTDDAGLVEKLGVEVAVVMGAYGNIKITTPEDLRVARAFVHARSTR